MYRGLHNRQNGRTTTTAHHGLPIGCFLYLEESLGAEATAFLRLLPQGGSGSPSPPLPSSWWFYDHRPSGEATDLLEAKGGCRLLADFLLRALLLVLLSVLVSSSMASGSGLARLSVSPEWRDGLPFSTLGLPPWGFTPPSVAVGVPPTKHCPRQGVILHG